MTIRLLSNQVLPMYPIEKWDLYCILVEKRVSMLWYKVSETMNLKKVRYKYSDWALRKSKSRQLKGWIQWISRDLVNGRIDWYSIELGAKFWIEKDQLRRKIRNLSIIALNLVEVYTKKINPKLTLENLRVIRT